MANKLSKQVIQLLLVIAISILLGLFVVASLYGTIYLMNFLLS